MRTFAAAVLIIAGVVAFSVIPAAQAPGTIEGTVKDPSGAVLPGVTVRLARTSTNAVERARTTVTDGSGRYRVVDLEPSAYAVTFTLAGFAPVRRVIEVAAGRTAIVDAEMFADARSFGFRLPGGLAGLPSRPYVLCGLTMMPGDPKLDAKMRKATPGRMDLSMPTVAPQIC